MTETKEEYITVSVFKCLECDGLGYVRNADFELCATDPELKEGDCKNCPTQISCNWGEQLVCECCDGIGHLSVDHQLFQPYGVRIIKRTNK